MKKRLICFLGVLLMGCQQQTPQESKINCEGRYINGNIELILSLEDDFKEGFHYEFQYEEDDMEDYALFDGDDQKTATSAPNEDGYSLRFTLKKDKVIIEENGESYLGVNLTGEYAKD